jgi:hypothetical protein
MAWMISSIPWLLESNQSYISLGEVIKKSSVILVQNTASIVVTA